jgi:hypothetical protein
MPRYDGAEGQRGKATMRRQAVIGTALAMALTGAALASCGASVAGQNVSGIWFNEPFIGGWSEQEVADEHCAQYGRRAVYAGELLSGDRYTTPVRAYNCK